MRVTSTVFAMMVGLVLVTGCERAAEQGAATPAAAGHTHEHADGTTHADHDLEHDGDMDNDHDHGEEVALGTVTIGGMEVELAQAHGKVEAGEEGHLVVKLPYNDNGETVVRAWIGTEDRTTSLIGKGEYAPAHGDYDIHAMAPDPLPEKVMWWIEIEQPDGTKVVGSAKPKLD